MKIIHDALLTLLLLDEEYGGEDKRADEIYEVLSKSTDHIMKMRGRMNMNDRIILVSDAKDKVYNLTDIIPEMMESENMTQRECIDYFMDGLEGERYTVFPSDTDARFIMYWINNNVQLVK